MHPSRKNKHNARKPPKVVCIASESKRKGYLNNKEKIIVTHQQQDKKEGKMLIPTLQQYPVVKPDAIINGMGPNMNLNGLPGQFHAQTHALINDSQRLGGNIHKYAGPKDPVLLTTQTQMAIPNKKACIIMQLFLPSAQSDNGTVQDPMLEHAISQGDFAFGLRMTDDMFNPSSLYALAARSSAFKGEQLINLTTVNYILWGLQNGLKMAGNRRWQLFFQHLCKLDWGEHSSSSSYSQEQIFNFLRSYVTPFGIHHGGDDQGGRQEGNSDPYINVAPYVAAFAVQGKILHVNNLWRCHDINEGDDLVLELRYMQPQSGSISFNLCSSVKATRTERCPIVNGWWYLEPVILQHRLLVKTPHIYVGRSFKHIKAFAQKKFGLELPPWNARACIMGLPIEMTFEPDFVPSDAMRYYRARPSLNPRIRGGGDSNNKARGDADESNNMNNKGSGGGLQHGYTKKRLISGAAGGAAPDLFDPNSTDRVTASSQFLQLAVTADSVALPDPPPPAKKKKTNNLSIQVQRI